MINENEKGIESTPISASKGLTVDITRTIGSHTKRPFERASIRYGGWNYGTIYNHVRDDKNSSTIHLHLVGEYKKQPLQKLSVTLFVPDGYKPKFDSTLNAYTFDVRLVSIEDEMKLRNDKEQKKQEQISK